MKFRLLDSLIKNFLTEAALTKGSQRVMNDKKLVADLADAVRDDARSNPKVFPANAPRIFQRQSDEDVARWFLEQLDNIERTGYEGYIYSRDGVNNEWLVRRYIAGSHNYEDLIGVANMNLRDWYLLKNRKIDNKEILRPEHADIPRFKSVRDMGAYINGHYEQHLEDIRRSAAQAVVKKAAKTINIVDNEDYKIYTVLNWAGARTLGLGTQWCTANSEIDTNYRTYSGRAMLFQLFPKNPEHVEKSGGLDSTKVVKGAEKYQFDAGTPCFQDLADHPVRADKINEKFPFLYYDLVKGLKENKEKIESLIEELMSIPAIQNDKITRVQPYNIDEEIKKLKNLKNMGFFTDKKRKEPAPEVPPEGQGGQPTSSSGVETPPEPQEPLGETFMENIDKDIEAMLQSLKKYDKLVESVAPVLQNKKLDEEPKKHEIPAFNRKESGKEDWKVDKNDLEKDAKKNISGKEGLDALKSKTGIKEEVDSDGDVDDMEDSEKLEEKDEGKHNNGTTTGFKAVAKNAAKEYGSKEAGERVAGAVRAKMAAAGKLEESQPDAEVIEWMKRFAKLG